MGIILMDIGRRVRRTRMSRKFTQSELSYKAGISQARLSAIELGKNKRPTCLSALATALDVCPVWLQTGEVIAKSERDREDYLYKLISSLDEPDKIREIAHLEKLLADRSSD